MAIIAKEPEGGDFTPAPAGTHAAVCFALIDIGTQYSEFYNKSAHKVVLGFELDTQEKTPDGKPFVVWKRYTLSLHENSALRAHLEAWRGQGFTNVELEGFDLKNVLDKPCLVTIKLTENNKKTYSNVVNVTGLPKQMTKPRRQSDLIFFDIKEPDMVTFETFSEKMQQTIRGCTEWQKEATASTAADASEDSHLNEDDIPF